MSLLLAGAAAADPYPASHHATRPPPVSNLMDTGPVANAASGLALRYGGTKVDVLTYHNNNSRTGWNDTETDLTVASVSSGKFGLLKTIAVDGLILAQPLLVSNYVMPDNTRHDVLIVVTEHDSIYALDAANYKLLWQVSLGVAQSTADVGCNDVVPEYGISATPVILRQGKGAATLYVVAATEPTPLHFLTQLHAIDVGTGMDVQKPVKIAPSAILSDGSRLYYDPQNQWSRAGLASDGSNIYVSIGSHCDNNQGNISGWLLSYSTSLAMQAAFHTIRVPQQGNTELASIWMSGFAPAIDAAGDVFVVTGNGAFSTGSKDWGESVLKLSPGRLNLLGDFTDVNYFSLNQGDVDFGSGGAMLLPPISGQSTQMAVAMGKSSVLYLLDQNKLGGLRPNNNGALQSFYAGGGGLWGGPAFYDGPGGPMVFVQTGWNVLAQYAVSGSVAPSLSQTANGNSYSGYGGSLPIISSNAAMAGSGIVWLIRRSVPMALEAYDAMALGNPIFQAYAGTWSNAQQNPFVTAMEANGRVYVPAYRTVKVFGLTP